MVLSLLDWTIIASYFALTLAIGILLSKRAGKTISEYFISGRSLPWWIAGTSMVATTFAADTPLAVTGLVIEHGLAGNWIWWALALGGMFTVFVFARLWRRAEVLTDVEFVELRYGGAPAAFLRGFRAVYVAVIVNSIVVGWVTGAMLKILKHTVYSGTITSTGMNDYWLIAACLIVVALYSTLSGLWGVALTDFIQFTLAMIGCIILAAIAVGHVGGIQALTTKVSALFPEGEQAFYFLPDFDAEQPWMPLNVFLIIVFVQWWATWFPGAEPGGGGFIVQRMASCKNERHALLATLWFQVAHYCIRPWPWLMIGFAALVMYPELRGSDDPEIGFPIVMRELSPDGIRGLMLVTFFAAFMSTISTLMNLSASYLVNDIYKRFLKPGADEKHLTRVSRITSLGVLVLGGITAGWMRNVPIAAAWKLLLALGAGTGAVFMLRWFWWRINAWSEITAMTASLIYFVIVSNYVERNEYRMVIVAGLTIVTWLIVTFLTPPERQDVLDRFYRKVRPGGPGWAPMARAAPDIACDRHLGLSIIAALFAGGIVYLTLPGVGSLIFGQYPQAVLCLGSALGCGIMVNILIKKIGWE